MKAFNTSRTRAAAFASPGASTGSAVKQAPHRWALDGSGNIANFDMKTLRSDIMFRLQSGSNLYTLEECRLLCSAMIRVATRWQEEELAQLLYLSELHAKVCPGRQVIYQWPPCITPTVPFCPPHNQLQDSPLYKITKVVEELNRGLVRMIDQLWNDRRERLLLAARILKDLEKVIRT